MDRADAAAVSGAFRTDAAAVSGALRTDGVAAQPIGAPEVEGAVRPMLEAVVRTAGASAGVIRVLDGQGPEVHCRTRPVIAAGHVQGRPDALRFWCAHCMATDRDGPVCARVEAHGTIALRSDEPGQPCPHLTLVPLRSASGPVGTLGLLFESDQPLPAHLLPLLRATGELIALALDHARLARESMRVNLTRERQAMAGEVHDSLAQGLTYMRMRMKLLGDAIDEGDDAAARKYWGDIDGALGDEHQRLRELIGSFRSAMDPQGLRHALAAIAATFEERTGIALELVDESAGFDLPAARELQVFRIVQEALANVHRHAGATRVRVTVGGVDDRYEITIEDDGRGIAGQAPAATGDVAHYGIDIMRERARRLGGELSLTSLAGRGTRVRLTFPASHPEG
jgi:two-component system nitrate/nitrite sensor histidine kinase NarX